MKDLVKKHIKKINQKRKRFKIQKNSLFFVFGLFFLISSIFIIWVLSFKIPNFNSFEERKSINSTKIYDRTGEILLYNVHQDIKRTSVPLGEMSDYIKMATIAVEDADFYKHSGVKLTSTLRAFIANTFSVSKTQGGSTITQQLVKNTLLTRKKTYTRKIREWVLALKIERTMSKDKILELYLNEIPYGGTIYGIEEASKTFFNKKAKNLTLVESAYLAGIPQSPTFLSPYGKNKDKLEERKNLVLFRMKEVGFITQEEFQKAKNEIVVFAPQDLKGIKAPHFVFYVKDYLEKKYGIDMIESGGLKVTTTIDYELQEKAEEIVKNGALNNEKSWNGSNAALVAIDPKTGQILTMVGSRDYFDKEIDGNFNVATALRQPGSAFKPIIYANAFEKGFRPETVLFDLPTEFNTSCSPYGGGSNCYMPENYDGKHRGPMTLRAALAQSINVPAVKLFYLAGMKDSLNKAKEFGITTLNDVNRYGLTLVIGGGEVSLLEMTSVYSVFANSGNKNQHTGILKIEDFKGNILEEHRINTKTVLSKNSALTLSDVLSDNQSRVPTFGANSPLFIPGFDVAAKTGTTNSNKDAWTIGYTPNISVGVWVGNNDNKPMKKGGAALAGPIWNSFMKYVLEKNGSEKFEKPDNYTDIKQTKPVLRGVWQGNENFFIDKISGKLATEFTPQETLKEKVITNVKSILYWIDKENILGDYVTNSKNDPQFNNWNIPIQNWWSQNSYKYEITTINQKPTSFDDIHTGENKINITIVEPSIEKTYKIDQPIKLEILNNSNVGLSKIDVFINGMFFDSIKNPFNLSFTPNFFDSISSRNEIKIIAYDTYYNKTEAVSYFNIEQN